MGAVDFGGQPQGLAVCAESRRCIRAAAHPPDLVVRRLHMPDILLLEPCQADASAIRARRLTTGS